MKKEEKRIEKMKEMADIIKRIVNHVTRGIFIVVVIFVFVVVDNLCAWCVSSYYF